MKKVLFALLIVFVTATGICYATTLSAGVGNEDNSPKVQSTFFGVKFGERNPWEKMAGLKDGWLLISSSTGINLQKAIFNVSFAGFEWTFCLVDTVEGRFSNIGFGLMSLNRRKVIQRYDSVLEQLSEKYPLNKLTSDELKQLNENGEATFEKGYWYSDGEYEVFLFMGSVLDYYACCIKYSDLNEAEILQRRSFDEL